MYRMSITKSTRGWKERLFSRNNTTQNLSAKGRRQNDPGIATMTKLISHLQTKDSRKNTIASVSNSEEYSPTPHLANQHQHVNISANLSSSEDGIQAPWTANSTSN